MVNFISNQAALTAFSEAHNQWALLIKHQGLEEPLKGELPNYLSSLSYKPQYILEKAIRIQEVFSLLLGYVDTNEVQIFPAIDVEGFNPLDLLVLFHQKLHLLISLRSMGNSKIMFKESKELLYVRRIDNKGVKKWTPDPLNELSAYQTWLTKNRTIFNLSSRSVRNTKTLKIILLWPPTRISKTALYSDISLGFDVLKIRKKGTIFIICKDNFIPWLCHLLNGSE